LQLSSERPKYKKVKIKLILGLLVVFILFSVGISLHFYSYVFARNVRGEVIGIDRVTEPSAIIAGGGKIPSSQIFSFAVAVRDKKGEIVTASTEDRQWAVVEKGKCVEAKYLPYPFWQLDKSGTYYGARLLKLYDCPPKE